MQPVVVGDKFTVIKDGIEYEFEAAEEGGYVAHVPIYPSAMSQGDTFEQTLENVINALEECLAAARDLGLDIPPELEPVQ
jgi:predicted RNase H-like HicB family nuclease